MLKQTYLGVRCIVWQYRAYLAAQRLCAPTRKARTWLNCFCLFFLNLLFSLENIFFFLVTCTGTQDCWFYILLFSSGIETWTQGLSMLNSCCPTKLLCSVLSLNRNTENMDVDTPPPHFRDVLIRNVWLWMGACSSVNKLWGQWARGKGWVSSSIMLHLILSSSLSLNPGLGFSCLGWKPANLIDFSVSTYLETGVLRVWDAWFFMWVLGSELWYLWSHSKHS